MAGGETLAYATALSSSNRTRRNGKTCSAEIVNIVAGSLF